MGVSRYLVTTAVAAPQMSVECLPFARPWLPWCTCVSRSIKSRKRDGRENAQFIPRVPRPFSQHHQGAGEAGF